MTPRHLKARELAAQGVPVFPCRGKIPACSGGFTAESTRIKQIDRWWGTADYNIGVRPCHMGLVAVDLDLMKEGGVSEALLDLLPPTLTHRTPSGGQHRLYKSDEEFGNQKLGVNADIRSRNGYILWPPSVGYERISGHTSVAPLPESVAKVLKAKPEEESSDCPDTGEDQDLDGAVGYCATLTQHPGRWQLAANLVRNFGLTDATATSLCELYGLRTESSGQSESNTSWEATLAHARKHGKAKLGEGVAFQYPEPGPIPEAWKVQVAASAAASKINRFGGRDPEEAANRPPMSYWDKHKTLPKGPYVGFAIGKSGSHKSGVFLKYALDIIEAGGHVVFMAAEGAYGIETARLPRAREARKMEWAPIKAGWRTECASFDLLNATDREQLCEAYKNFSPSAIFVDVIAKVVPDINEPKYGMAIMAAAQEIAIRLDCLVVFAHHPPLTDSKRGLGSTFLHSLADFEWLITKAKDKVWLEVSKMKDGPAEFSVPYGVDMSHGAPVITECERQAGEIKPLGELAQAVKDFLDTTTRAEKFCLKTMVVEMRRVHKIPKGIEGGERHLKNRLDGLVEAGYLTITGEKTQTDYCFQRPV